MLKRPNNLNKLNEFISLLGLKIPGSYLWLVNKELNNSRNVLDIGCGNGLFMYILNHNLKYAISGIDIFKRSVREAKNTGVYKNVKFGDIRKLPWKKRTFDIVISNHVIEHLEKKEGFKMLDAAEKIAKTKVIIITPFGDTKQQGYDGNKYQEHKSAWYPEDFKKRGYKVIGQGLNLYRDNQIINKVCGAIGPLNNLFFLLHVIFQPFINSKYSLCHQIICIKNC